MGHTLPILASDTLEDPYGEFFLEILIGIELEGIAGEGIAEVSLITTHCDKATKVLALVQGSREYDAKRVIFALILK